jgi:hypothetical protein
MGGPASPEAPGCVACWQGEMAASDVVRVLELGSCAPTSEVATRRARAGAAGVVQGSCQGGPGHDFRLYGWRRLLT